ncbi:MAG TPA: peptide chain release factor N(5)-glutamine methyltransferase, partial [Myxococcaceae bacterium]|nr:peptide chain release factor N(5)-glutamine methyltransferase [Myxococcaceae bacterium]
AEVLLAHALRLDRVGLYLDLERPLEKAERVEYRSLVQRRTTGDPTQYLTGKREFYGRSFQVDPRVMIPRPETELLVERVLREIPPEKPCRLLDLCTGSGCIAISIAAERAWASVWATELSAGACEVARLNAESLEVASRVTVLEGNLFGPLPAKATFDLIVSNPPYIRSAEIEQLSPEVRREPRPALDGGLDGLALLGPIIAEAPSWLKPEGLLAMEIGECQGDLVLGLLRGAGYIDAKIEKDLARQDRFALGRRPR